MIVLALIFALQADWWDARPNMGWTRTGVAEAATRLGGPEAVIMFIRPGPRPNLHWQRIEAREANRLGVFSTMSLVEVDCPGGRDRYVQGTYYSQPNLEGRVIHTESNMTEWKYPLPDTLGASFFRRACQ